MCRLCCGADDCGHVHCHYCVGHIWEEWNVYPKCDWCRAAMNYYLHELTGSCFEPDVCDYEKCSQEAEVESELD